MMFAMLVGTPPFETKSLGRTYAKIAANEYEIPERLSPSAKTFIAMLLNPEPKNRGHLHHSGRASLGMSVLTGPNRTGSDRIRPDRTGSNSDRIRSDRIGQDRTLEFAQLNTRTYIFLYISGHPFDVLSHTFFQCGFSPRKLPQSAVSQAPTFPLDTVLSNGNSAENIGKTDLFYRKQTTY